MKNMQFVMIHGSYGNAGGNWFPYLKTELEKRKQQVMVPQFPVDDWDTVTKTGPSVSLKNQSLSKWLNEFAPLAQTLSRKKDVCFIGHSLGPLFILHLVEKYKLMIDSAVFVAPFFGKLDRAWQIDHANRSFWKDSFDFADLRKRIPVSYVLYSNNDPYVDPKYALEFADKLGSKPMEITNGGHMNGEAGFTEFPAVLKLCKSRIR